MNRKIIILTVFISILILTVGGIYHVLVIDSPSRIAINDIEGHRKYQDNHSKVRVNEYYEKLLSEYPNDASANYYVARLIDKDSADRAIDLAMKSIKLDATNKYNYIILSDIYRAKGNFSKCFEFITKANEKGVSDEEISYRRLLLLDAMLDAIFFDTISTDKFWLSSTSFRDFFYKAQKDAQYFLDNSKYLDTHFGIHKDAKLDESLFLEKFITHRKQIEVNTEPEVAGIYSGTDFRGLNLSIILKSNGVLIIPEALGSSTIYGRWSGKYNDLSLFGPKNDIVREQLILIGNAKISERGLQIIGGKFYSRFIRGNNPLPRYCQCLQ